MKGGTNSSKQRSVNTSPKKDVQRQDARKHFLSELRSKGESAVIKNITKTLKASKEKPILNPRHGQKKFNTPVYLTRITPKTSPRQGMKMTYLKSKVPVKMHGCQTKHQSSENKEAPKEPKIEKSENVEEAVFPKEDMGEEEKVKVKKLSDKELFFSTAKDEQMTLLEDKNTKLTVHRDANEKVKGEPISFIVAKVIVNISFHLILHKKKFFIRDFFSKYDQICIFLRIWSDLLKNSLIENFIFCTVLVVAGFNAGFIVLLSKHFLT